MKDNISTSITLNRKIVIELRFAPSPKLLDLKGTIINSLQELKVFTPLHWEIGDAIISIKDEPDNKNIRNHIIIELNRLAYISSKIDSIESYYSRFQKIYTEISKILDLKIISRIGCRIQGTYKVKSTKFDLILENFKKSFPTTIFLEDFPTTDLLFQLNYKNGMYRIGPIKENDEFLKREFPFPERKDIAGIGMDTDNFLLDKSGTGINDSKIKDVVTASLAVEKSLYEKMKDF